MRPGPPGIGEMSKQGFGWLKSLALVPLPLFIVLIIIFACIDTSTVIEPPYLLLSLNILFLTIIPFSIAYVAWRSYADSGQWRLFLIGCGMVAFGFGALVAGAIVNVPGGTNLTPSIHNTGALIGAILIGIAAIFSIQEQHRYRLTHHRALYLGFSYLAVLIFMSLFAIAAYEGMVPLFFVQGTGPTVLRQFVLGTATVLFAASSVIFIRIYVRAASDFTFWFSLSMTLITVGLCAVFLQKNIGSPLNWVGRAAQYLGCVYLLIGVIAAYCVSNVKRIPLGNEFARSFNYIEANYQTLVEMAPNAVISVDDKGSILTWNPAAAKIFGYLASEAIGANAVDFIFPGESALLINSELQKLVGAKSQAAEPGNKLETIARRKQGEDFPVEVSMAMKKVSGEWLGTFIISDITERKRAGDALRESEFKFRSIIEHSGDVFYMFDVDARPLYISPHCIDVLGYTVDEFINIKWTDLLTDHPMSRDGIANTMAAIKTGQKQPVYTMEFVTKGGSRVTAEINESPLKDPDGKVIGLVGVMRDITERKQAEDAILRSKLLLQSVIDSTPDWIYVKDFKYRYLLVNKSFAESQKVVPQDMIGRPDTDFFPEELCLGNLDKGIAGYHQDDEQAFQGQILHNPRNFISWADGSLHIYDTYKIPLADQSGKIYAALVYSRDMTEQRKAEDEREAYFRTIQKTLHDVINTMAKIVEIRDPYTSGHQARVAALAGAIAREMKLDDTRVEHLVMAASIHDVGKMYVPSDILSKPGKLSDIEWAMIKTHAQGSYDILKDLEFSQPVALMALQHHERLDGSGYPNGLKGDQMLLESKILAVADVVEAMGSHRPYRPTLGLDKALEEISSNKGVLYDPDVVDTCLKLFREQGFKFEG